MTSGDDSGSDDVPRRSRGRPRAGVSKPDESARTEAIRAKNRRAQKAYRLRCKEQLDQLESSLAERRQRMNDMHEQRGRLARRREQLQQELQRAQSTLCDLRTAAEGILEEGAGAMAVIKPRQQGGSGSGSLADGPQGAVPMSASPGVDVNAAAENSVYMLRANLEAAAGASHHSSRHSGGVPEIPLAETRTCGMPLEHGGFEHMPTIQAAVPQGYGHMHKHYPMH
eukprot:jgi/Ulvmu1/9922/UM058_0004.1